MPENNKIKILHIITNLPVGGAQDNMLMTLERLNRDKYLVGLLCSSEGEWLRRAQAITDLHLYVVNSFVREIRPLKDILTIIKAYSIIKKHKFQIVHTHTSKGGFIGRIAAKLAGVPIIVHTLHGFSFHDYVNPLLKYLFIKVEYFLSKITDRIITVSNLNLNKAIDAKIAPPEKFVTIYNGIDFRQFDVNIGIPIKREELGINGRVKIIGTVGRLCPQKAPQDLIYAIPEILKKTTDVLFIFVGDGELLNESQALVKKLGIENYVRFLGSRKDIPELLHIFDVFVLSSLWEGMPRSVTEAMYCARPVVATAVDGTPELVENSEMGILVPPKNFEALAQGILTLLNNEDKAKRMGAAAKKRITEDFSIEKMVEKIEDLYNELVELKIVRMKIANELKNLSTNHSI